MDSARLNSLQWPLVPLQTVLLVCCKCLRERTNNAGLSFPSLALGGISMAKELL
jgi:hypothetical protein